MIRSRRTALLSLCALAVLASGCGSRLDPQLRQEAAAQALGRTTTPGTAAEPDAVARPGTAATVPARGAAAPLPGTAGGRGPASGPVTGGVAPVGAPAPAGGNGGAVDVGVTATELRIGTIADLSGPVPGLFQGAIAGVQAYVAKVNAEGGLFGRRLVIDAYDSKMECSQFKAATGKAMKQDFALVGSFSLYDACGVETLKSDPRYADVHEALQDGAQTSPNNFSVAPFERGWRLGPLQYMKKRFGSRFQHVGSIYASVGGGAERWGQVRAALEHAGGHVDYERGYGATETDFTADIIQMRQRGVQLIYLVSVNAAGAANLVKAARAQGVDWPVVVGGAAYDAAFLAQAGADAEGVFEEQQYALFFDGEDARNIPAVADFQTWMRRTGNGDRIDLFAAYGWGSAALFVQALEAAGPRATRAELMAQLKKVHAFDAGGLLATSDPAGKRSARCWLLAQVRDGRFVRVDTPAKDFRCDGGYFRT